MDVFCGIDWAEDHHDIAIAGADGTLLARKRIGDNAAGLAALLELLAAHGDTPEDPVPVAIETPRGLLVACLRATGRPVYPVNPMAVARYRDRHSVAGRKSDPGDAFVLANVLRTTRTGRCRPIPSSPGPSRYWPAPSRTRYGTGPPRTTSSAPTCASTSPASSPRFAGTRDGILRPEARVILAAAPTPAAAGSLTLAQLRALLKKAGRTRGIDAEARRLREAFREQQMRQLPLVEQAMGRQALALLRQLDAACTSAGDLERAAVESFNQHPDAGIITSFPGLGPVTGARVLAEIVDDRSRFSDAKGLKAYAGAAPITRASGKHKAVLHRKVKNNRLAAAGYIWAFASLTASPGARRHYDRRRDAGDGHAAAQRNLFSRLLGCLHHCLLTGKHYREATAFPAVAASPNAAA